MNFIAWIVFLAGALLEIGGDAVIRCGLHGRKTALVIAGFGILGCYGLLVNLLKWDFSRLFAVYAGVFAMTAVLAGQFIFQERIPTSTWIGVALIMAGCLTIQLGR